MDIWTFGWTLALIGMGGTMLVLWCIKPAHSVDQKNLPVPTRELGD